MTDGDNAGILVVDDSPDRLELMSVLLDMSGYRVLKAFDGREALEVARRERPLLVVSDVSMPRGSGIDLCRWIRADAELFATPILLVSAQRKDSASAVEGLQAGADDYLEAPYDPMRFVAKVARLGERARFEGALRESEQRYALAAQGANDGLWDWDLKTGRVYYSARWKAMLGCAEDEVGETPEEWTSRVHPDDAAALRAEIDAHVEGRSPHFELEHRMLHKDGGYRWMLSRGIVVRDHEGRATRMAGSQTDITDRKRAEERLIHDAFHDPLTGLPNRALFMDRLGQAVERFRRDPGQAFAVLFLDLDRFKVVNDSLGHTAGDHLLIEVGRRLAACARAGDTVARLGGDEFTILLEGARDAHAAVHMAERVQEQLARPCDLGGHRLSASASIGIALAGIGESRAEDILRDASIAMHRAKSAGKARHQVFDAAMHAQAIEILRLETELRRGVAGAEMCVCYQPIVSLRDGRLAGAEALVRWRHPDRGLVYPEKFLATAEETGLIIEIDRLVLDEACRQAAEWRRRGPNGTGPSVAVNLSAKHFAAPDLVEFVAESLERHGLAPDCLKLEITEGVLLSDAEQVKATLKRLRGLGVDLYLDDFGTGYSSLSYLHRIPLTALKIDRSFVGRIGARGEQSELARAIVMMAHSLKLSVIAEGIETDAQLAHLRSMGCELGQGNLFSRPASADEVGAMLKNSFAFTRAIRTSARAV
ncbi:MAG TPA: EAL domain-containing protein [Pyrinomonadaceae bacterium]|nr:EAL domain-containing protein [Pyrinomonadaceae bacterium]